MQAILSRHTGNRRSYVFDLRQPEMTGRQLDRTVDRNTAAVMRLHGISGTPTQAPADLWAHAALKCGYTPQAITGCLGFRPTANPVFALCPMQPIPDSDAMEMRATVARVITDDPLQWFVMRLRPASGFSSLLQRLASIPSGNHAPTLFYPCEEIATRIGRRLVWRDRPVIPDIVFSGAGAATCARCSGKSATSHGATPPADQAHTQPSPTAKCNASSKP